jgi:hypothetical protein
LRLSRVVAPFGVSFSFSSSFLVDRARLAHQVDLLLHLLRALDDALVGDLSSLKITSSRMVRSPVCS